MRPGASRTARAARTAGYDDTAVTAAAPCSTRRPTSRAARERSSRATSVPCSVTTYGRPASQALTPAGIHQCAWTTSSRSSRHSRARTRACRCTSEAAQSKPAGDRAAATMVPRYASVSQRAEARHRLPRPGVEVPLPVRNPEQVPDDLFEMIGIGDGDDQHAARLEDAMDLRERPERIGHMLEHFQTEDEVIGAGGERDPL